MGQVDCFGIMLGTQLSCETFSYPLEYKDMVGVGGELRK